MRQGDLQSLAELIPRYKDRLYRYLLRFVREQAVAEDLFQETWLKAAENMRRYDRRREFDGWLFAIAHNLAIDYLRRRRPESLSEERDSHRAGALDRLIEAERSAALAGAVAELPALYRETIALRFGEEMKLDDIAAITRTPLPTVKTRLRRALEMLRERFQ